MAEKSPLKYKRVLLKLSGESLMGPDAFGINRETLQSTVEDVKEAYDLGVEIGVVVCGLGFDGYGTYARRPHGYARYVDECLGSSRLLASQRRRSSRSKRIKY